MIAQPSRHRASRPLIELTLQALQEVLAAIKRGVSDQVRKAHLLLRERVRSLVPLAPSAREQLVYDEELAVTGARMGDCNSV